MLKRKLSFILALTFGLSLTTTEVLAKPNNLSASDTYQNKQIYDSEEGKRTIYWTQGIEAPLIDDGSPKIENRTYFQEVNEKFGNNEFHYYEAQPEIGKGYYDFNKNIEAYEWERQLCFLGTAGNLLSWWLEQNKDYIEEYQRLLKTTDTYGQVPVLKQLLPYDEKIWQEIYPKLEFKDHAGDKVYRLEMHDYPFFSNALRPYYNRQDGGFPDQVFDYFLNGYRYREERFHDENQPSKFEPGLNAGYFYNIFGKTRLSKRYNIAAYDSFSKLVKEALTSGKALGLAFMTASYNVAHAITLWGAEYDLNGDIKRIYITDSDDYGNTLEVSENGVNKTYSRGLTSMDVKNDNGIAKLTTQVGLNGGAKLEGVYTLDLGRDIWEEKLNDKVKPEAPIISFENPDANIALNAESAIKVEATIPDNGQLGYTWYEADSLDSLGKEIGGAHSNIYKPNTKEIGDRYYYCEIYNEKNGHRNKVKSRYIKVSVKDIPLVDAMMPNITFNTNKLTIDQYSDPYKLTVNAWVNSGELSYQWYQTTQSLASGGWALPGETKPYLYINAKDAGRYFYYCVVTNSDYSSNITGKRFVSKATSYAKMVVVAEKELDNARMPFIKNELGDLTVNKDRYLDLALDVTSPDGGILSYQWYQIIDGREELLALETKPSYKPKTRIPGIYEYKCVITNVNAKALNNQQARKEKLIKVTVLDESGNLPEIEYGPIAYEWDLDKMELKATRRSLADPNVLETETVKLNKEVIAATCTNTGLITYRSEEFKNKAFSSQTKEVVIPALGHNYGEVIYSFDLDSLTLTAKRVCINDSNHGEEETVKLTYSIKLIADCHHEGLGLYTSEEFKNKAFSSQTKEVVIPKLMHQWGEFVIVEEPTTKKTGLKERVCELCGDKETVVIPVLASDDNGALDIIISLATLAGVALITAGVILIYHKKHKNK